MEQFLEIYLKEVIRVVSGIWGVSKVHDRSIFGLIDAVCANLQHDHALTKKDLLELPLLETYEEMAFSTSELELQDWISDLKLLK